MDELAPAKAIADLIGHELKLLWTQMDAYQEFFGVELEKRSKLMEETAPGCFTVIRLSLIDSLLMRIFRLLDPAKTSGHTNCSFAALRDALSGSQANSNAAMPALDTLMSDWQDSDGPYAGLKIVRNKDLSHNDRDTLAGREPNQLWISLTQSEFAAAQALAGRLWRLYRQAMVSLNGCDVMEPRHSSLADKPAMLLKHLSSSLYLDKLLGDDRWQNQADMDAFEAASIGEDRLRQVFAGITGDA